MESYMGAHGGGSTHGEHDHTFTHVHPPRPKLNMPQLARARMPPLDLRMVGLVGREAMA